jgi:hypothetical protein
MALLASEVTNWCAIAIGVGAAAVAAWQLLKIGNQLRLSAETNVSSAYAVVSDRMAALRDLLDANDAALYPYFYDGLDPDDEQERPNKNVLDLACEAIVDFADVCVEQRKSIPHAEMDWSTWDAYFRHLYQNSPILRRFLRDNQDFYPDYLMSVFGYIVVRVEHTGEVTSEWQVAESPDGLRGYPWMRTWLITKICDKNAETHRLEAAVEASDPNASTIIVRCKWTGVHNTSQDDLDTVLYSWVLWQLTASPRWQTASIIVGERTVRTERLMSPTWRHRLAGPQREGYLAPKLPFDSR